MPAAIPARALTGATFCARVEILAQRFSHLVHRTWNLFAPTLTS